MRFTIDTDKIPMLMPDSLDFPNGCETAQEVHDLFRDKLMANNKNIQRIEDVDSSETGGITAYNWQVFFTDGRRPTCRLTVAQRGGRFYPKTYLDFDL